MRFYFKLLVLITILCSCKDTKLEYPITEKIVVIDNYFGTDIEDPYRWMEDDKNKKVKDWIEKQNQLTYSYLDQIPYRESLQIRLEELWNYEKIGTPFKEGSYTYFYKNNGLQNQSVLYRKKENKKEEIFINPNNFSKDGTISLRGLSFTEDGSLLAYSISEGGSDWRKIIIINTSTKEIVEDTLLDIKFSGVSWHGNEGFYYSSYDKPKTSVLSERTNHHKLYYHKLGTSQEDDKIIFGNNKNEKFRYVRGYITKDQQYLVISVANETSGNNLFIQDQNNKDSKLIQITNDFESNSYVIHNIDKKLYIVTNFNAPNKKVITVDANNAEINNWKDFIAETENVLNISKGGGYFFAQYFVEATSKIKQYSYDGKLVRNVALQNQGNVSGFGGKEEEKNIYYNFSNYITPSSSFKYNVGDGSSELFWAPDIDFNKELYVSEQMFYKSKDGTDIPITINYKKGLVLNGENPTILYGYGGFNISIKPFFSIKNAIWMEQGGIYAVANIRGGGEYGKKWHNAGTKMKKQNVFDDFIAAAEFLIEKKYTSKDYLAINGRSNGGLLVGACMTQKPDLFKVALPEVGVLDMLRYHTFTSGAGWAYDYGTAEDSKEMFNYLKSYSPVHNVKENKKYPSTMILTADHDDRVVPAHSFKFAAQLQNKQNGNNPILIRIETNSGHGSGTPTSKRIEEIADVFSFTLYNMGFKKLPLSN
ncbi:MAG: prolyl oligopeptidase family serine peptidase [Bacteroidota bacterium]|nr:prolyl oligopeptidase family serine peptidase [Bacteroidota bacterium]